MHVVLIVPGGVDRGGRERVIPALLWLIEGLAARHQVTVVALGQEPEAGRYELRGATVINVPPEHHGPHRLARQVIRAVRAVGSDGRPDVVHGLWASVTGLSAVIAARRYRVPSLVHVAGGELVAMPEIGYGGALGRGGRAIGRYVLRRADEVTVATQWMVDHVAAATAGFGNERRAAIVPLGVDLSSFSPSGHPIPGRLVHVASLNAVKDQTTLLTAFALVRKLVPAATLDVIGVDTLGGQMQRLAIGLGLAGSTMFHGFIPSDELPDFYRRAELHVISSRHDAGPVAVLEAGACGVATVGTSVGHIADLAAATRAGAVAVEPGNAVALADAIVAALADRARRRALAEEARAFAVANDSAATVRAFEAHYERLIAISGR